MRIIRLVGIVATGLLLAGQASAIDMCFEAGGDLFVARAYKRPSPGKCRPLTGYEAATNIPHPATGTACLNASSTKLYVHWNALILENTAQGTEVVQYSSRTELPYPSLTNGLVYIATNKVSGDTFGYLSGISAFPCDPAPLP